MVRQLRSVVLPGAIFSLLLPANLMFMDAFFLRLVANLLNKMPSVNFTKCVFSESTFEARCTPRFI